MDCPRTLTLHTVYLFDPPPSNAAPFNPKTPSDSIAVHTPHESFGQLGNSWQACDRVATRNILLVDRPNDSHWGDRSHHALTASAVAAESLLDAVIRQAMGTTPPISTPPRSQLMLPTFDTTSSTTRLVEPTSPMTRRRRSSFTGGTPNASTDICVQQALTSDEFVQRRKRRGGAPALEHQSSDSALARQPQLNRKSIAIPPPKSNVGSSRDLGYGGKSPDANGSPALLLCSPSSASTIKASMFPRAATAPDGSASERTGAKGPKRQPASRAFGSFQRPRSRPRSPRAMKCGSDSSSIAPPSPPSSPSPSPSPSLYGSPALSRSGSPQQIHSDVHVPQRSIVASSCPAPRGATLSLGRSTPVPLTSSILAEGQVELSTNLVAVEVLADLQCGRSVTSSECGDRDREHDHDFGSDFFVYDCTAPRSIPDVPPTDPDFAANAGASLPSPRSPTYGGLVPLHPSGRSSTIRNHTAPLPVSDLDGMRAIDELRRCASASPISTSPPHQGSLSSLDKTSSDEGRMIASGQISRSSSTSRSSRNAHFRSGEERLHHESDAGSAQTTSPDGSKVLLKRPPLHTYTSFESAFDVAPPPSPPASPKGPNKGWPWQRS